MFRSTPRRLIGGLLAAASLVPLAVVISSAPVSALPPGTPPNHPVTMLPATGDSGTDFKLAIAGVDQFCAGDGVAGYFWHTFITPLAQDPATLTYPAGTPTGLAPTVVLRTTTGSLLRNQFPGTGDGFVNLNEPTIDFSSGAYGALTPGSYHIGAGCTAPASQATDEYWSTIITITASPGGGPNNFIYQQGIPEAVPPAPVLSSLTPGNGSLEATFTTVVGNPAVTEYTVTADDGVTEVTATGATSPITVAGLTNGTEYDVTVVATNTQGDSLPSNVLQGTPVATVPDAPTAVAAARGNGEATVSWTAPADDGGSAITGYVVTPFIGAAAQTSVNVGNVTSTLVTGLTNGTAYTFRVAAVNTAGTGAQSAASAAVTPATVPDAPTAVVAVGGNSQASVSWTAPASNGGSAITGYIVTPYIAAVAQTPVNVGAAASTVVPGLTNGTAYTFRVAAVNAVGTGTQSADSAPATPLATVPAAPTDLGVTPGDSQITVIWTAPTDDGGSPITGYVLTPYINGVAQTPVDLGNVTITTVTGLTNGTIYTFRVAAVNAIGTGSQSAPSTPIPPFTTPDAPTSVVATAGAGSATVSWTAPAFNGGVVVTSYVVTPFIGAAPQTPVTVGNITETTVFDLTNGTAYTFTVAAVNFAGRGADSAPSSAVTPITTPTAPTAVTATAGVGEALVSWTPPASDGGSPITGYVVTPFIGAVAQTPVNVAIVTSATIPGLTNGTAYTFSVAAKNAAGTGVQSTPSGAVTPKSDSQLITTVSPTRLFDTRTSEPQGAVEIAKRRYSGTDVLKVKLVGVAGVPETGVGALSMNVTAVFPDGPGFVAVFPCGDVPNVSNINFTQPGVYPNAVIAPVSPDGEVCFYSTVGTDLIADLNGWLPDDGGFGVVAPTRVFDTRASEPQAAVEIAKRRYSGSDVLKVKVLGVAGVPATGVAAVSLNVAAVFPDGPGFVAVFPCGDLPNVSNINFTQSGVYPNAVIAPVSAEGEVCFYSTIATDLIADVNGWLPDDGGFGVVAPTRVFDTRTSEPQAAVEIAKRRYSGSDVLKVKVLGVAGVPMTGVAAVSLNVAAVFPDGPGFVAVFPCGDVPNVSNINFTQSGVYPNAVIAPVSPQGEVCFFSSIGTDLIADVNGWFAT